MTVTTLCLCIVEKEEIKNCNAHLHKQLPCFTLRCFHEDSRLAESNVTTVAMGTCIRVCSKSCLTDRQNENLTFFFFFKKGDFCQYIPSPCTKGMLRVDFTCKGNWSIGIRRHWLGEAISSGAYFICTIYFSSQKVSDDRLSSN